MKRIRYYDLVRVICFLLIIFYHMTIQLVVDGICTNDVINRLHANANMHIGIMAVAVFFLLSGASLGVTTKHSFSVRTYFKKRLIRLLVPFYIATAVCMGLVLVTGIPFPNFDPVGTPKWRLIFTLLGLDTWLTMHHVQTFSLGIGEWFLGALIILSLLFPLFRLLIRMFPKAFFIVALCVYAGTLYAYTKGCFPDVGMHVNLLLKGFEFILGIYLGFYREKIPQKCCFLTIPVCLIFFFCPLAIPVSQGIKITVLAVCFFLSFSCLEKQLQNRKPKALDLLSGYSYELYLCHHMVIYLVYFILEKFLTGIPLFTLMFTGGLIGMLVVTVVLKAVSDWVIKRITSVLIPV